MRIFRLLGQLAVHSLAKGPLRRFVRQDEGAVAIEFALVALPFFLLLFAILETAMVFFVEQTLETATADAARLIMTGQAQQQGFDQSKFRDAVCDRISNLFNCKGELKVDVRKYTDFASAQTGKPVDQNGNLIQNFEYQPGCPGDIVVVRTLYQWSIYVPGLHLADSGGKRLLMATSAFRNEPYPSSGPC
ncbi:MAG TPA: TadE/TadG family type IV pilus assembly protein [Xanthobacteraceae bacterium]|nr:TadE/TadG family type IV pilus assembly protein [Xanthobacteraceae bacterium]